MLHCSNKAQLQCERQVPEVGSLLLGSERKVLNQWDILLALEPPFQARRDNSLDIFLGPRVFEVMRECRLGRAWVDNGDVLIQTLHQLLVPPFLARKEA